MRAEAMIEVTNLQVQYKDVLAVNNLSFQIQRGEVFGLLGPNGAGKTTTLSCIEGLRRPNKGVVRVGGHDVTRDPIAAKQLLGVQLQKSSLFTELTTVELIRLYAALYNVFPSKQQITVLLERFGLSQKARARVEQLSGGQQQRLALAIAIVNNPQVVLLDEPSTGLDPQARRGVWALIRRMQSEGRTILLTTHSMEEAQELCNRVGIMHASRLVALDTPTVLIQRHVPPLTAAEAARRQPNLEDVFLALTGNPLGSNSNLHYDEEAMWLSSVGA